MKKLDITINGHVYTLACDDGEEKHVAHLAREIDRRARDLAAHTPKTNEALILVMTLLMMGDEIAEARDAIQDLRNELNEYKLRKTESPYAVEGSVNFGAIEAQSALVQAMQEMAEHIDQMAQSLEKA